MAPDGVFIAGLPDEKLAALAAGGARRAYGELVRRHASAVRALVRRMGADPATADDIAQDAFLVGFQRIADYRGDGAFAGWIKRIAARLYLKRAGGKLRLETPLDGLEEAGEGGEVPSAMRLDLDRALEALNASERLCVTLCHGLGLSHQEAADQLKAPLGTVKSHVKRGLDKLRARLGEGADDRSSVHG